MAPETIRLFSFVLVLSSFVCLEQVWPARRQEVSHLVRWSTNFAILALGACLINFLAALVPFILALATSHWAETHGIGLLNQLAFPIAIEIILSIVIMDFAIWFQHYLTHKIPILWRIHAVHHADICLDASTALRFHPLEIAISALYKSALVVVLGPPFMAVLMFEITLNACAIFNHANIQLPRKVDEAIRWIIITPSVHLIHHDTDRQRQNTNFGFCFSFWDRIFRTYTPPFVPARQTPQPVGLDNAQNDRVNRLLWCLALPFRSVR